MKTLFLLLISFEIMAQVSASHTITIRIEEPFWKKIDTIPGEVWTIVSKELNAPRKITLYQYDGLTFIDTLLYSERLTDVKFLAYLQDKKRIDSIKQLRPLKNKTARQ